MSLTRKDLKAMGIDEEKIDVIVEKHRETVDALKAEVEGLKDKASDYDAVCKERDELKKAVEDGNKDSYKVKYEAIKEDFEKYKSDISAKETKTAKETAYRALLKECGVSEKRIEAVMRVSDIKALELDDKGKVKNSSDIKKSIKEEWADFIVSEDKIGANTPNPPSNNGGNGAKYESKAEIMKISDAKTRQQAIADNPQLFGYTTE